MLKRQILFENIRIAIVSVLSHRLRSVITILIIAFGITALVGILTAIDAIKYSLRSNFSSMGANTFNIQNFSMSMRGRGQVYENISYREAMEFKNRFEFPATVGIQCWVSSTATVRFGSEKTNPNIAVKGVDESYLVTSGYTLKRGRNFSQREILKGEPVIILGGSVSDLLFGELVQPEGSFVFVGSEKYRVVGILHAKGSGFGFSEDKSVFIPLKKARSVATRSMNYSIDVTVNDPDQMEAAINQATQLFRIIRRISPGKENNFEIAKSDNLAKMLIENMQYVTLAATLIGLITLLGAAIGLMNIMLVNVTERTKEIGTRKAIGATSARIRNQFLIEAVIVGQFGGILGILLGMFTGNLVSYFMNLPFIVPWGWMIFGVLLCFIVGIISGWYPAGRASKLDPVEALRYE